MSFFSRLINPSSHSAATAKERLQLVLAHDRINIPPATLELLKEEIISVISHHVEIDRARVQVEVERSAEGNRLIMNIPVLGTASATKQAARSVRERKAR
ncbi:MAG: cell division topological specificity factor MinE [Chloroflexi bacterium]|nr:cell division topological specificity factor MinE [Chloroflexota bacterium]MBI3742260.1 cell division topological specificity factor MinE [Chloroflexota bacterium]